MPEVIFSHGIDYPDASEVTLTEIANTLISHEKLSPILARLFENLIDGVTVDRVQFSLERLERSSLKEAFFVALLLVYQKDLEKEVSTVIEAITGQQVGERFDTLVTVLVMILLFYGGNYIINRLSKKDSKDGTVVLGDFNVYVDLAGSILGVSRERVIAAVERAVSGRKKRTVGRAAIDFFRPAKRGKGGRIAPRGTPEISEETVRKFPSEAALSELGSDSEPEPYTGVRVEIRATDRDWQRRGWYGIVREDGFPDQRVSMVLYPTVDANALADSHLVRADILAEWDDADAEEPRLLRFHVLAVHERLK